MKLGTGTEHLLHISPVQLPTLCEAQSELWHSSQNWLIQCRTGIQHEI
jgi:hypothetical protein